MSWVAKSLYFGRTALVGIRRAPFVHFVAVTTLAIALFAWGIARSTLVFVDALISSLGQEVRLTVYLEPGATEEEAEAVATAVKGLGGAAVQVVSPALALQRLADDFGELGNALRGLSDNPLSFSVEMEVPSRLERVGALEWLAQKARGLPRVAEVDYGEEAVRRLGQISRALKRGGGVVFAILILATVVIVSATLQLAIYSRREEIEIQKLVGGTDLFVKVPFLLEGLVQGLLGALLAGGALWAFGHFAAPRAAQFLAFLAVPGRPLWSFEPDRVFELMLLGGGLGLLGSFVAVGRFLRV